MKTLIVILVLFSTSVYSEEIRDVSLLCKDSDTSLSTTLSTYYLGIEFRGSEARYFYLDTSEPLQTGVFENWGLYEAGKSTVKFMAGSSGKFFATVNRATLEIEIHEENILILYNETNLKKNDLRCEIFTNNTFNIHEYLEGIFTKRDKEVISKNKF